MSTYGLHPLNDHLATGGVGPGDVHQGLASVQDEGGCDVAYAVVMGFQEIHSEYNLRIKC